MNDDAKRPTSSEHDEQFLRLYTHHQRQIYAYLATFLRDAADVDEVLQETSIVLWHKFGEFDPERSFPAWAIGVARYELFRFCRSRKTAMLPLDEQAIAAISRDRLAAGDSLDSRREALQVCLEKLRLRDRELVQRCYTPGVTSRSVAQQLGR